MWLILANVPTLFVRLVRLLQRTNAKCVAVCVVIAARHSHCSCFRFHCACRAKLEQHSVRFTLNTADTNPFEVSEIACARRDNAPNNWKCMFASASCRICTENFSRNFLRCWYEVDAEMVDRTSFHANFGFGFWSINVIVVISGLLLSFLFYRRSCRNQTRNSLVCNPSTQDYGFKNLEHRFLGLFQTNLYVIRNHSKSAIPHFKHEPTEKRHKNVGIDHVIQNATRFGDTIHNVFAIGK